MLRLTPSMLASPPHRLILALLCIWSIGFGVIKSVESHAGDLSEYDLKAAFVYNFSVFTKWPDTRFPQPDSPINLLVIGHNTLFSSFKKIQNKPIDKRVLEVTLNESASFPMEFMDQPDIVFFSSSMDKKTVLTLLNRLEGYPVLTIGEEKDFIAMGGMVNFFLKGNHLYFEVNLKKVRTNGIHLSSRLLNLAIIVED